MNEVRVNRKAAGRVASGHPWIFASDVDGPRTAPQPGDAVEGRRPARPPAGHRALQFRPRRLPCGCSRGRSKRPAAIFFGPPARRRRAPPRAWFAIPMPTAWCTAKADLLPALIVDRYGDYLVVQTLNQGMDAARDDDRLLPGGDLPPARHRRAQRRGGAHQGTSAARIRGARRRDPGSDRRPHERPALAGRPAARAEDRHLPRPARELPRRGALCPRRRALDCFTSTGGFALHLAARCESVEAVDSSPAACLGARQCRAERDRNYRVPGGRRVRPAGRLCGASSRWSCSIRRRSPSRGRAWTRRARGYKEINLRALRLLGPGGMLVTCSCSHP